MEITINIDEKELTEVVTQIIAKKLAEDYSHEDYRAKMGIRDACSRTVQKYVYSQKDKIIERVIINATREIVRKGLPKLLEQDFDMSKENIYE